jgi:methylmalonyl-CoA mutase
VLDVAPVTIAPATPKVTIDPLPAMRLAEPFEKLRDASDRLLAETGARPRVFLANLGTLADFTARATFARNFFEAGGIAAVTNDGFPLPSNAREAPGNGPSASTNLPALVAAFRASGAKLACLCSSDHVYAAEAIPAARALAAAGAMHIYLAGRPGKDEQGLREAGIGTFIHAGCDVLATLQAAHDILAQAR